MHTENSILIRAPLEQVYETTAQLERWPAMLPHYRWIRVLRRGPGNADSEMIVQMAARRGWLPIHWTSQFAADRHRVELRFRHLKSFTKGMEVTWTYTPTRDGVLVRIRHDLDRSSVLGRWFARRVLGAIFIAPVANRTLRCFKDYLEQPSVR